MNCDSHFKFRLRQRFGLSGKKVIGEISDKVNPETLIKDDRYGNPVHMVHWEDKLMFVVRSRSHGGLVTVLTHRQYVLRIMD